MQDPTHSEMMEALAGTIAMLDGDTDSAEVAIYWFANDWHGGGSSNLYEVLCTSLYNPGPICRGPNDDEVAAVMLYEELEAAFS